MAAAQEAGAVTLNWGVFINSVISFLIVAFALFMVIKGFNKMKREEEEAPAQPGKRTWRPVRRISPLRTTRQR